MAKYKIGNIVRTKRLGLTIEAPIKKILGEHGENPIYIIEYKDAFGRLSVIHRAQGELTLVKRNINPRLEEDLAKEIGIKIDDAVVPIPVPIDIKFGEIFNELDEIEDLDKPKPKLVVHHFEFPNVPELAEPNIEFEKPLKQKPKYGYIKFDDAQIKAPDALWGQPKRMGINEQLEAQNKPKPNIPPQVNFIGQLIDVKAKELKFNHPAEGKITIPLYRGVDTTVGITHRVKRDDYTPNRGNYADRDRLLSFMLKDNEGNPFRTIYPIWLQGGIYFLDTDNQQWTNTLIEGMELDVYPSYRQDEFGVSWCRKADLVLGALNEKPKLFKLRQKYKKMPVVQEESDYADKKYIA
jgi:hypothetical protein